MGLLSLRPIAALLVLVGLGSASLPLPVSDLTRFGLRADEPSYCCGGPSRSILNSD